MRSLTNLLFLAAVLALNLTLMRPSPVDYLFILALCTTVLSPQAFTRNSVMLFVLVVLWLVSMWMSSITLLDEPEILVQAQKITYALSIALCASLVVANWADAQFLRFFRVIVAATCLASILGTAGFLLQIEDLTWDGRAKGLLDDPNMYSAFLLSGLICAMFLLAQGGRRGVYVAAMAVIFVGLLLGFSRVALVSFVVWGGAFYLFLNRRRLPRAILIAGVAVALLVAAVAVGSLADADLAGKIADRSTVAKEYDSGRDGRYGRYELAVPLILENPLGLGILQTDKIWPEPIHNLLLSSFLNYGWIAGFALTLLIIGSVAVSIGNYRATRNPICLCVLFAWLAIETCTFVHETERWRHLWMFFGVVWGLNARRIATMPARDAAVAPRGAAPPRATRRAREGFAEGAVARA